MYDFSYILQIRENFCHGAVTNTEVNEIPDFSLFSILAQVASAY